LLIILNNFWMFFDDFLMFFWCFCWCLIMFLWMFLFVFVCVWCVVCVVSCDVLCENENDLFVFVEWVCVVVVCDVMWCDEMFVFCFHLLCELCDVECRPNSECWNVCASQLCGVPTCLPSQLACPKLRVPTAVPTAVPDFGRPKWRPKWRPNSASQLGVPNWGVPARPKLGAVPARPKLACPSRRPVWGIY
jgi:hypothetical protein